MNDLDEKIALLVSGKVQLIVSKEGCFILHDTGHKEMIMSINDLVNILRTVIPTAH